MPTTRIDQFESRNRGFWCANIENVPQPDVIDFSEASAARKSQSLEDVRVSGEAAIEALEDYIRHFVSMGVHPRDIPPPSG